MSKVNLSNFVKDLKSKVDCDFKSLDWFDVLVHELELFSIETDMDLHINVVDKENHNTRLVIDIEN